MKPSTYAIIVLSILSCFQLFYGADQSRDLADLRKTVFALETAAAELDQFTLGQIDRVENKARASFYYVDQELKRLNYNQRALIDMVSDPAPAPLPKNELPPGLDPEVEVPDFGPEPTPADPSTRPPRVKSPNDTLRLTPVSFAKPTVEEVKFKTGKGETAAVELKSLDYYIHEDQFQVTGLFLDGSDNWRGTILGAKTLDVVIRGTVTTISWRYVSPLGARGFKLSGRIVEAAADVR